MKQQVFHLIRSALLGSAHNVQPDLPLEDQPDFNLFWEHLDGTVSPHVSGRRMICGHTRQTSGLPLDLGHAVCIDTNACGGGWLTCLETGTGIYWQANQEGELRRGCLKPGTPHA